MDCGELFPDRYLKSNIRIRTTFRGSKRPGKRFIHFNSKSVLLMQFRNNSMNAKVEEIKEEFKFEKARKSTPKAKLA